MKGVIIYSSLTGNTKRMAEYLYDGLKDKYELDIVSIKEEIDYDKYDFALIGGYIDRSKPDRKVLKLLETITVPKLGLFATMGADPESPHGLETLKNMRDLLKHKGYIGSYLCRGKVDDKLIKNLQTMKPGVMPQEMKEKMLEVSLVSRPATEDELKEAVKYFEIKLNDM